MSAITILLIVSTLCWFFAAIPLPWSNPVHLGWLGLFFYGITLLMGFR